MVEMGMDLTGEYYEGLNTYKLFFEKDYYIGSAEGHEYPDLQVGDEVNPRTFLAF